MAKEINYKNVLSFLEGNAKYYISKFFGTPTHIQEQVKWRLTKCKDDCVPKNKCIKCGCPTDKKVFNKESCNPERHPDLMDAETWIKYKKENKIEI